jgi:antitoxin component YwqK of YwqJK toxin-antitoxin module
MIFFSVIFSFSFCFHSVFILNMSNFNNLPFELVNMITSSVSSPKDYLNLLLSNSLFGRNLSAEEREGIKTGFLRDRDWVGVSWALNGEGKIFVREQGKEFPNGMKHGPFVISYYIRHTHQCADWMRGVMEVKDFRAMMANFREKRNPVRETVQEIYSQEMWVDGYLDGKVKIFGEQISDLPFRQREELYSKGVKISERTFHVTGEIKSEAYYVNGFLHTKQATFVDGSRKTFRDYSKPGHQLTTKYYRNGEIQRERHIDTIGGEKLVRLWYSNGRPELQVEYKNGKLDGSMRAWNRRGKMFFSISFCKGRIRGCVEQWANWTNNPILRCYGYRLDGIDTKTRRAMYRIMDCKNFVKVCENCYNKAQKWLGKK